MTTFHDYLNHSNNLRVCVARRELISRIFERRRPGNKPPASIYEAGDDLIEAVALCEAEDALRRLIRAVIACCKAVAVMQGWAVSVVIEQPHDLATADQVKAHKKRVSVFSSRHGFRSLVVAGLGRQELRGAVEDIAWTQVIVSVCQVGFGDFLRCPQARFEQRRGGSKTVADCLDEFYDTELASWVA